MHLHILLTAAAAVVVVHVLKHAPAAGLNLQGRAAAVHLVGVPVPH
jgi:hypothetical protein